MIQELAGELILPEDWSQERRWISLNYPGKPDFTATKIATQGLELPFNPELPPPPLHSWKKGRIPKSLHSNPKILELLGPTLRLRLVTDTVTTTFRKIPHKVHVSRVFLVPKDEVDVRPVIDLSFFALPKSKVEKFIQKIVSIQVVFLISQLNLP